jgi:hypothetical protein
MKSKKKFLSTDIDMKENKQQIRNLNTKHNMLIICALLITCSRGSLERSVNGVAKLALAAAQMLLRYLLNLLMNTKNGSINFYKKMSSSTSNKTKRKNY